MHLLSALRRCAFLLAALLVVAGAAGAHVHRGEHAPLEGHGHSTCALCVHADLPVEPTAVPSLAPPPATPARAAIAAPCVGPDAAPRGAVPGRAPPR